jgi:hypothetical protein
VTSKLNYNRTTNIRKQFTDKYQISSNNQISDDDLNYFYVRSDDKPPYTFNAVNTKNRLYNLFTVTSRGSELADDKKQSIVNLSISNDVDGGMAWDCSVYLTFHSNPTATQVSRYIKVFPYWSFSLNLNPPLYDGVNSDVKNNIYIFKMNTYDYDFKLKENDVNMTLVQVGASMEYVDFEDIKQCFNYYIKSDINTPVTPIYFSNNDIPSSVLADDNVTVDIGNMDNQFKATANVKPANTLIYKTGTSTLYDSRFKTEFKIRRLDRLNFYEIESVSTTEYTGVIDTDWDDTYEYINTFQIRTTALTTLDTGSDWHTLHDDGSTRRFLYKPDLIPFIRYKEWDIANANYTTHSLTTYFNDIIVITSTYNNTTNPGSPFWTLRLRPKESSDNTNFLDLKINLLT